jgi:hypothetical protein
MASREVRGALAGALAGALGEPELERSPDTGRATAGSDPYPAKASTSDSRKRRRNSLGVRSCMNASSVIPECRRRSGASVKFRV